MVDEADVLSSWRVKVRAFKFWRLCAKTVVRSKISPIPSRFTPRLFNLTSQLLQLHQLLFVLASLTTQRTTLLLHLRIDTPQIFKSCLGFCNARILASTLTTVTIASATFSTLYYPDTADRERPDVAWPQGM